MISNKWNSVRVSITLGHLHKLVDGEGNLSFVYWVYQSKNSQCKQTHIKVKFSGLLSNHWIIALGISGITKYWILKDPGFTSAIRIIVSINKTSFKLTNIKVCFKRFVIQIIKLHNFFNIYNRGIIQSVVEKFWAGQLQYKQKAQKILKFQRSQGRQKI